VPADGPDPAAQAQTPAPAQVAARPADELWPNGGDGRYSRDDIRQQSGLDDRAMKELESFGLLPEAGPEGYGPEALTIAKIASASSATASRPATSGCTSASPSRRRRSCPR